MDNPFESGHIKNYVLSYASVLIIMALFFVASTLFHEVGQVEKKIFDVNGSINEKKVNDMRDSDKIDPSAFKLIEVRH